MIYNNKHKLNFCVQVVDIMRVNVDKVLERDQKLSELDDRADALQAGASQFETSAAKLKRKYWWKNCKVTTVFNQIKAAHWTYNKWKYLFLLKKKRIALMVVSLIKHTEQNNAFFCCSALKIHIEVVIAII